MNLPPLDENTDSQANNLPSIFSMISAQKEMVFGKPSKNKKLSKGDLKELTRMSSPLNSKFTSDYTNVYSS